MMKLLLLLSLLLSLSIAFCEEKAINEVDYHIFELGHLEHEFDDIASLSSEKRSLTNVVSLLSPLYSGYGTHYAYVYVGTPPQKQTLILDTASHITSFPCEPCKNCGKHVEKNFDGYLSKSYKVSSCGIGLDKQNCKMTVNYDEGSKWEGYKATDHITVGGLQINSLKRSFDYTISNFEFGCETYATGEFKSQLANGVLSMSRNKLAFSQQLTNKNITSDNIFAMCLRTGGGILTIGGFDSKIHKKFSTIQYALMLPSKQNYFTVKVENIQFTTRNVSIPSISLKNINILIGSVNNGTGAILDSGTSDIFLPISFKSTFVLAVKTFTGVDLSQIATNSGFKLTQKQYTKLPDIVFKLKGKTKNVIDIIIPYMDYIIYDLAKKEYRLKIYFTLQDGAIFGENFFNRKNIIFDSKNERIGIADSDCIYENFVAKTLSPTKPPTVKPVSKTGTGSNTYSDVKCPKTYLSDCNADCFPVPQTKKSKHISQYYVSGTQDYKDCYGINSQSCHLSCVDAKIVRGNPYCADTEWTKCDEKCLQSRYHAAPIGMHTNYNGNQTKANCGPINKFTRKCFSAQCPTISGDYIIDLDIRISIEPSRWSYVYKEDFFNAISSTLGVQFNAIELLNDARSENSFVTKLHFQIRILKKDHDDGNMLTDYAESLTDIIWSADYSRNLINALEAISIKSSLDHSRYSWLNPSDIQILNAAAVPVGTLDYEEKKYISFPVEAELMLVGVVVISFILLCISVTAYNRLSKRHELLEKDKLDKGSLSKLFGKFLKINSNVGKNGGGGGKGEYSQIPMNEIVSEGGYIGQMRPVFNAMDDDTLDDTDTDQSRV